MKNVWIITAVVDYGYSDICGVYVDKEKALIELKILKGSLHTYDRYELDSYDVG